MSIKCDNWWVENCSQLNIQVKLRLTSLNHVVLQLQYSIDL